MARSHDGEFVSICQMGFIHTKVVLVGWRHNSLMGLRGMINAPDAFVRTVSCACIEASLSIPSVSVGKGYSLCILNGDAGFTGTMMASPLGVTYDDKVV